jgi:hypothetical protein
MIYWQRILKMRHNLRTLTSIGTIKVHDRRFNICARSDKSPSTLINLSSIFEDVCGKYTASNERRRVENMGELRKDTCGKHTASYETIRVENIQRVTLGYVRKTHTELREDTRSKCTASYARIRGKNTASYATIRVQNIQLVTQPTIKYNLSPTAGYFSPVCVDSTSILKDSILTSVTTDVYVNITVKTTRLSVKIVTNFMFHPVTVLYQHFYIYKHQSISSAHITYVYNVP